MSNARFWTGLVFCTGLPASLVMGTMGGEFARQSPVYGKITFNGRPLTTGSVLFESLDRKSSVDIPALLDRDGHFSGQAQWALDRAERTRFRIHVYPDPRTSHDTPARPNLGGDRTPEGSLATEPAVDGVQGPMPPARVEPASIGIPGVSASSECSALAGEGSGRDRDGWFLEVWIGPEPTRIDIDMKD